LNFLTIDIKFSNSISATGKEPAIDGVGVKSRSAVSRCDYASPYDDPSHQTFH